MRSSADQDGSTSALFRQVTDEGTPTHTHTHTVRHVPSSPSRRPTECQGAMFGSQGYDGGTATYRHRRRASSSRSKRSLCRDGDSGCVRCADRARLDALWSMRGDTHTFGRAVRQRIAGTIFRLASPRGRALAEEVGVERRVVARRGAHVSRTARRRQCSRPDCGVVRCPIRRAPAHVRRRRARRSSRPHDRRWRLDLRGVDSGVDQQPDVTEFEFHISPASSSSRPHTASAPMAQERGVAGRWRGRRRGHGGGGFGWSGMTPRRQRRIS